MLSAWKFYLIISTATTKFKQYSTMVQVMMHDQLLIVHDPACMLNYWLCMTTYMINYWLCLIAHDQLLIVHDAACMINYWLCMILPAWSIIDCAWCCLHDQLLIVHDPACMINYWLCMILPAWSIIDCACVIHIFQSKYLDVPWLNKKVEIM